MKNWVDWVILIATLAALVRGYRAGLLSTLFSAIGYIGGGFAGLFISLHFVTSWHSNATKFVFIIVAIFVGAGLGEVIFGRFAKFFHGKMLIGPLKFMDSLLGAALSIARTLVMIFIVGKLLMAMPWAIGHHEIPQSKLFSQMEKSAPKISFNLHSLQSANPLK
jgi:MFS family permease